MTVFSGQIWNTLKSTLGKIATDSTDGIEKRAFFNKWMKERQMEDAYEDDAEYAGPAYAASVPEGTEYPSVDLLTGYTKRYLARKFGVKMSITEETMDDTKYPEVLKIAGRLKQALFNTMDVDGTDMLIHATDTNYPGGDGLPLASASHTLANGGTFSNLLATPMSPSRAAVTIITSMIRKLPGHHGAYGDYEPVQVLCPVEQWYLWDELIGSRNAPEAGEFNRINVVNRLGLKETIPIKWWDTTTTAWGITTNCEDGFNWRWRKKPNSKTWVENSQDISFWSISARWDCGYTDARCFVYSNA